MTPKIYVATAYRWGWSNNSWYTVHVGLDETAALNAAQAECQDRGGKYGIEVVEHCGDEQKAVGYYPSSYGEDAPHFNHRLYAADNVGIQVVSAHEDGMAFVPNPEKPGYMKSEPVTLPDWLVERVKREIEIGKMIEERGSRSTG